MSDDLPPVTPASAPFWDATRDRRYLLPWCPACRAAFWYPREVCPTCLSPEVEWKEAAGTGTVHTFTVEHRPAPPRGPDPYVIALVDLDEGVRVMGNVLADPTAVAVGTPVRVAWQPLSDGRHLPQWELAA